MTTHQPESSYVVWHTQRTGSTLLCTTLERTGVAGHPDEWTEDFKNSIHNQARPEAIRDIWKRQTSRNGLFGLKFGFHQPFVDEFFAAFSGEAQRANALDRKTILGVCVPQLPTHCHDAARQDPSGSLVVEID